MLFIYIELIRFSNQDNFLGHTLNSLFLRFADRREKSGRRLLLTHLYLLIGLGIPTNLTWILLGGGFPDGEMAVFAYSGVIFLGILDTFAAVFGREWGTNFWRIKAHFKTQEGTLYSLILTCIFYYIFCAKVYSHMCTIFGIIFFATFLASIVEGWTS